MRLARAAFRPALPVLALAALGVLGAHGRPSPEPVATTQGSGNVMAPLVVRIVTDGHPQVIALPAPRLPRRVVRLATPTATPVVVHRIPARRAAVRAAVPVVQPTPTDGYPYASSGGDGTDPWGFTTRQCVSYVAWRLADAGRPIDNARQGWGSALDWDDTASRLGYAVSTRPSVGAVAQWNANEHGAYWSAGSPTADGTFVAGTTGHVAWVTKVYADGSVQVAQYNGMGDRTYSTMRVKAPRYLSL